MSSNLHITLCVLLACLQIIIAYTSPTTPGTFVSCSGIAASSCLTISGCCTAGVCFGSGCCPATEICAFPNTPRAGCCRFDDPTLCGSLTISSSLPASSGPASNSPVDDPYCTHIRGYVNATGPWTYLLGKPCGFVKGDCGTCPALLASGRFSSTGSYLSSVLGESSTRSSGASSTTGSISFESSLSAGSSGNDASPAVYGGFGWEAVVALVPAYVLAV